MLKIFQIFFQNRFDFFENAVMFHLLTKEISSVLRIAGWYFQAALKRWRSVLYRKYRAGGIQ